MRKTLKHILAEYGAIAVVVYLSIFSVVLGGAWAAIHLGWQPESLTGNVGAFTAAYLATKVVQPFRIAATLALTPIVAAGVGRFRGNAGPRPTPPAPRPPDRANPPDAAGPPA